MPFEGAVAFGGADVVAAAGTHEGAVVELVEGFAVEDVAGFGVGLLVVFGLLFRHEVFVHGADVADAAEMAPGAGVGFPEGVVFGQDDAVEGEVAGGGVFGLVAVDVLEMGGVVVGLGDVPDGGAKGLEATGAEEDHGVPPKDIQARTAIKNLAKRTSLPPTGSSWNDQADWATVLLDWLDHGHETYYEAGIKYSWIWNSFTWPSLSVGGVIEVFPSAGPMMGSAAFSWLRLADAPEPNGVNGSVYKVTSTWLGGPNGHWDPVLYS